MGEQLPVDLPLTYSGDDLYMDEVPLADIAQAVGTPAYVYSAAYMTGAFDRLIQAFAGTPVKVHYSVKANSNLSVLRHFAGLGAGFDIVSGGELLRVLAAGGDPASIIFSGVGKSVAEIDLALKTGIACFNVESAVELERLASRARLLHAVAPVSIRVNPDVNPKTHPYISTGLKMNKFGVSRQQALALYQVAADDPNLRAQGIDCHIGSQITDLDPLLQALTSLLELVDTLAGRGIALTHIDLGGGMGIRYRDEEPLDTEAYGASVKQILAGRPLEVWTEPGRSLVGNAGVLLTRVECLKPATAEGAPNFAVVDAAMNDLIRPALYQAWHGVYPVARAAGAALQVWEVVGPVCESGDFLAHERELALQPDSLLAIASAGAYGMVQASNYNSRGRPCEVMVNGDRFDVIRRRETIQDMLRLEQEGSA